MADKTSLCPSSSFLQNRIIGTYDLEGAEVFSWYDSISKICVSVDWSINLSVRACLFGIFSAARHLSSLCKSLRDDGDIINRTIILVV